MSLPNTSHQGLCCCEPPLPVYKQPKTLWIIKSYGLRIHQNRALFTCTLSGSNYTEEVIKLKMIVFVNFHHKRVMHLTIILCRSFLRNELLSNPRYTNKENQIVFLFKFFFLSNALWGVCLTAMAGREWPLSKCFNFQLQRSSSRSSKVIHVYKIHILGALIGGWVKGAWKELGGNILADWACAVTRGHQE